MTEKVGRGGARPGAGRKRGSRTVRTTKVAEREISSGRVTPLEVMLKAMRDHYDKQEWAAAAAFAKDAAPYMHPKLQSVMHSGDQDKPIVTDNTVRIEFVKAGHVERDQDT